MPFQIRDNDIEAGKGTHRSLDRTKEEMDCSDGEESPLAPATLKSLRQDSLSNHFTAVADLPSIAPWTFAKKRRSGDMLPQTIAHRGYKTNHPENTMGAFQGAVEVGTDAIETDIHLTKDDVVVLCHDSTMKRCFGDSRAIKDCTWDDVKKQRTLKAPHEAMPRLSDLLHYLAEPGNERIWVLLDIKHDNSPSSILRLIASTIASTPPHPSTPWSSRILLGIWLEEFLPYCAQHLPNFPVTHIGFSVPFARRFLKYPHVSFNILQQTLMTPHIGNAFMRDARARGRPIYDWTVNEEGMMRWSIKAGLDGVITDDPELFLQVRKDWEQGKRAVGVSGRQWSVVAIFNMLTVLMTLYLFAKHRGLNVDQRRRLGEIRRRSLELPKPAGNAVAR